MSTWVTLQTHSLIGRTKEQEIIRAALRADGLRVIFFIGEAGIGKTRLLNEIPEIFPNEQVAFADLIDLYHTDFHTISGIEKAIINSLDPEEKAFKEYREKRKRYEQWRKKGAESEVLEKLYAELSPQFVSDLNKWCRQNRRVVLRLDTVELVQSEQEIHPLLAGTDEVSEVRGWLVKRIPELNNAVVLLAGRPEGVLWQELQGALGGTVEIEPGSKLPEGWQAAKLISIRLGPLQERDVPAYFAALAERNERIKQAELTWDHYQAIHRVTRGRPLHLAFVATLLTSGELLPDALLADLDQGTDELNRQKMLEAVWNLSRDIHAALPFVGWLRKGVDGVLLSQVMTACLGKEWTPRRSRRVLAELRRLPFVKTRGQLVFLHDEMYDLLDDYVLNQETRIEEKQKTCETAIAWYDSRINQVKEAKRRQQLEAEQLYYRLLQDPDKGFEHFQERSDEALIGREVGFEMAMRDEVLRFFLAKSRRNLVYDAHGLLNPRGRRIARDMATRQVLRLLRRGKNQEACELANQLWEHNHHPFDRVEPSLFGVALQVYRGEALAYLGEIDRAIEDLSRAIDELNTLQPLPVPTYLLGLAHKNRGYVYVRQRGYKQAIQEYLTAIKILTPLATGEMRRAQLELAHTQRNLAYIYGEYGERTEAEYYCEQALAGFRKLNYRWGEALTLNVRGGIEAKFHEPYVSSTYCKEALRIFTIIDDKRGIGLSSLWLGRAYRRLGAYYTHRPTGTESQELFEQAHGLFQYARTIFENEVREPIRLVETIAEQGKLYRDWAKTVHEQADQAEIENLKVTSEKLLKEAIRLADETGMIAESADCRQDLANLYYAFGEFEQARDLLEEAEAKLPPGCILRPQGKLDCPAPGNFEILGKIYMARGDIAHAQGNMNKAIELWTLAAGYFGLFSSNAQRFVEELVTDVGKKLFNESYERLRELEQICERTERQYGLKRGYWHDELARLAERRRRETA